MNFKHLSLFFIATIITFSSCDKTDEDTKKPEESKLITNTIKDLYAPQEGGVRDPQTGVATPVSGPFVKFSFAQGKAVSDDSWDIAFRNTTIIVNGGAKVGLEGEPERKGQAAVSIVSNVYDEVTTIPNAATFLQDAANTYAIPTGGGKGWYNYDMTTHIISPAAGKILVVKTHDGKYAKVEILSFYQGAPKEPNYQTSKSPYYTFKYAYQQNGTALK